MISTNNPATMQRGPKVKLAIDLQRIDKFFPLESDHLDGFSYERIIDRHNYDRVAALLEGYNIYEDQVIQEFCFILIWIVKETHAGDDREENPGKFYQMWVELDNLKDYLLNNRITSISFRGEYGRNKPGAELTIREDINIDRLCDGIRSVFRDEFNYDKQRRRTKGLTAWQSRKMIRIKNNFLNYFTTVPILDKFSLEDQIDLINKFLKLAGLPG